MIPSNESTLIHESPSSKNSTILIVEDDTGIREMLKIFFEIEGFEVQTATNGREGLETLPNLPNLKLIFLDLMMPVMNGWEFIEEIKKTQFANLPVVIVTAYPEKVGDISHMGVIKKPIDLNTLLRVALKWCREKN